MFFQEQDRILTELTTISDGDISPQRAEALSQEAESLFLRYDSDRDGCITPPELQNLLSELGVELELEQCVHVCRAKGLDSSTESISKSDFRHWWISMNSEQSLDMRVSEVRQSVRASMILPRGSVILPQMSGKNLLSLSGTSKPQRGRSVSSHVKTALKTRKAEDEKSRQCSDFCSKVLFYWKSSVQIKHRYMSVWNRHYCSTFTSLDRVVVLYAALLITLTTGAMFIETKRSDSVGDAILVTVPQKHAPTKP